SALTIVAVLQIEPRLVAKSDAPLAFIYSTATGRSPVFIGLIGMFAVVNGALIQLVMASRLLYGMSNRGWLPAWFSRIHSPTRTPLNSTLAVALLILVFAMMLPMVTLAEMTSSLILIVFILINLALIRIKLQQPEPEGVIVFPSWIPKLGLVTACTFLLLNIIKNIVS
nr:amino acid permease [Gammaproteobacteria bacterium]